MRRGRLSSYSQSFSSDSDDLPHFQLNSVISSISDLSKKKSQHIAIQRNSSFKEQHNADQKQSGSNPEDDYEDLENLVNGLKRQIEDLKEENEELKQRIKQHEITDTAILLHNIKNLEIQNRRLKKFEQNQIPNNFSFFKQTQSKPASEGESAFSPENTISGLDYKYIIQTLQQTEQHLRVTNNQLESVRAQYQAYKLYRKTRGQLKGREKIAQYQLRSQALSNQVLRLNDELAVYRQTEIQNRQMKSQLLLMMRQIEQLKSISSKSNMQQQYNEDYVKELSQIIDEQKIQECKINEQLLRYQKQNDELRRIINKTNHIETILDRSKLSTKSTDGGQKCDLTAVELYDRIRQISVGFNVTKAAIMKGLSFETKRLIISSLSQLEMKFNEALKI